MPLKPALSTCGSLGAKTGIFFHVYKNDRYIKQIPLLEKLDTNEE
jgi:hypothetical protein